MLQCEPSAISLTVSTITDSQGNTWTADATSSWQGHSTAPMPAG
jgi:hypothetical protein